MMLGAQQFRIGLESCSTCVADFRQKKWGTNERDEWAGSITIDILVFEFCEVFVAHSVHQGGVIEFGDAQTK